MSAIQREDDRTTQKAHATVARGSTVHHEIILIYRTDRVRGVGELLVAHEAALAVLAGHGLQPDPLRPERVAPFSMWIDRVSMDHLVGHKVEFGLAMLWKTLSLPPRNASLIKADRRTAAGIERWMVSAIPTAKSSF